MLDPAGRDVVSPTDVPVFVLRRTSIRRGYIPSVQRHRRRGNALAGCHSNSTGTVGRPLPDLKSRPGAAPNIRIHAPDETLIAAVMVKCSPTSRWMWAQMCSPISSTGWIGHSVGAGSGKQANNASLAASGELPCRLPATYWKR